MKIEYGKSIVKNRANDGNGLFFVEENEKIAGLIRLFENKKLKNLIKEF